MTATKTRIKVGIDVGAFSVGMTTIAADENDTPLTILSSVSHIHDSGLDKDGQKTATTRREASGVARRARRLVRSRRRRLRQLDELLHSLGYPVADTQGQDDPYLIWRLRARLVEEKLPAEELPRAMSMALRHIARHRGWRNPYSRVESLLDVHEDSTFMDAMRDRVTERTGLLLDAGLTPGQVMAQAALTPAFAMRGPEGLLGKLHQGDNAQEILKICSTQGIPAKECRQLILAVFASKSPRGSAAARAGRDPLPGQRSLPRAPKCDPEFQRYRVISIVANLRIRTDDGKRRLTQEEKQKVVDYLLTYTSKELSWVDVAEVLALNRQDLRGTATLTADGERAAARPPVDVTDRVMRTCGIKPLRQWWETADDESRSSLVQYLYEGSDDDEAAELLASLSETDQAKLDSLHLPAGRAAYSHQSLAMLNERMLTSTDDLHEARKHVFGVDDNWTPPAEPIGAPVGNPSVDRTLKAVARYLHAVRSVYGEPTTIQVEHVRAGFSSKRSAQELDKANNKRYEQNQKTVGYIREDLGIKGEVQRSDVMRYEALMIQDGVCVYCGASIDFFTAQLDHIVPQAGPGSNNHRDNLVAVCERCNRSKSNQVFAVWARTSGIPGVSLREATERVKAWRNTPEGMKKSALGKLKRDVIGRLSRTEEDPPLDSRSLESVAWMANELHHRIQAEFPDCEVAVYRGSVTAAARKAAGVDSKVNLLGEQGRKDRLDRRHHAVDAAVIALMRPEIAKTLAERSSMRWGQRLTGEKESWKQYTGVHPGDQRNFERWRGHMEHLTDLLNKALVADTVHVTENIRLRLGNGAAHDDTVRPLHSVRLGDGLTARQVDRASTPALWRALTQEPDFSTKSGLPARDDRTIRVHGRRLGAADEIQIFGKKMVENPQESPFAAITVRGGFAEIGGTIHHARIFRIDGKKPSYTMLRVFACDLHRHRHGDLFSAPIPPQSISMRCADPKLRKALADGSAQYLGWIVVGDELVIPMDRFRSGKIGDFLTVFPRIDHWRVHGFPEPTRLRLRPSVLSAEGIGESIDAHESVDSIVNRPGWRLEVNPLFSSHPTILRRDALGRPRHESTAGLPTSWTVI